MSNLVFATYIITNGLKNASKAKTDNAPGLPGLAGMFFTPLSASGTGSATHWASSGYFQPEEIAYIDSQLPVAFQKGTGEVEITVDGKPTKVPEDGLGFIKRQNLKIITSEQ